jgi:hypothetical protein
MIYFGNERTAHGELMSNYIDPSEFGLSIEPAMQQIHGSIPETSFTRSVKFGCGWRDRKWHPAGRRFWITGRRCAHEQHCRRAAWSIYWCERQGFSFTNWLKHEAVA